MLDFRKVPAAMVPQGSISVVLLRAGSRTCALPVSAVVETMRPLPITAVDGLPSVVRGVAIIRGQPVPVIDLNLLLDATQDVISSRFVVLRLGERRVALAVAAVLGLCELDAVQLAEVPPLLQSANAELLAAIGTHDRQLLILLEASRIVSDDLWQQLPIESPTG